MLVKDIKVEMLEEISYRQILSNDTESIEERCDAIIRLAAKKLSESLKEVERNNLGDIPREECLRCSDEIAKITYDILLEELKPIPLNILKIKIIDQLQ